MRESCPHPAWVALASQRRSIFRAPEQRKRLLPTSFFSTITVLPRRLNESPGSSSCFELVAACCFPGGRDPNPYYKPSAVTSLTLSESGPPWQGCQGHGEGCFAGQTITGSLQVQGHGGLRPGSWKIRLSSSCVSRGRSFSPADPPSSLGHGRTDT